MRLFRSGVLVFTFLVATVLHAQSTLPALSTPIAAQTVAAGGAPVTVDLRNHFTLPDVTGQVVQFNTVLGRFNFELFADTPITTANFLSYVNSGAFANTIIHRSVPGFVVQGGGYTYSPAATHIPVGAPIRNEFGRSNVRGTVAMAKLGGNPNSATSEWFVNLGDNRHNLNPTTGEDIGLDVQNGGFTVFARVLGNGMSVIDSIAALQTADITFSATVALQDVPVRNLTPGQTQLQLLNLVAVNTVTTISVYPSAGGGPAVLSFSATSASPDIIAASVSGSTLTLAPGTGGTANTTVTVTVTATDTHGSTASQTFAVTLGGTAAARAPVITAQPQPQLRLVSGTVNKFVVFTVAATGVPTPAYQWRRNNVAVTGQTSQTYVLTNASDAQAGTFTCVVTNSEGSVESQPSVLSFITAGPAETGRLINLSILSAFAASETMVMGTVLGGTGTAGNKTILARAAGPSLTQFGVTGVMPDPQLSLVATNTGTAVATNNDWAGTSALANAFAQVGAFAYSAANSKDAALLQTGLAPGDYTALVSDANGTGGAAITELYDSTPGSAFTATTPRLINVSVLKQIPEGSSLTAGFVIGGTTAKTVLVRAIGPTLAGFGVAETMSDPQLTLFNSASVKIAENDNWGGDAQVASVASNVGAFSISNTSSNDAILLLTLAPGNYTVQVSGNHGGGKALVEVYEVP